MSRYSDLILADAPALYWRLGSGGGDDQTANNRDGTGQGGITIGGATGMIVADTNAATDFDGTDDSVNSSYAPFTAGDTWTFEGWANRDTSAGADTLIGSNSAPNFQAVLDAGATSMTVTFDNDDSWQTFAGAWPGNGIPVYWVLVFNDTASTVKLYIQGDLFGTLSGFALGWSAGMTFQIGARAGASDPFDGKMDEVALYSGELTAAKIREHYRVGCEVSAGNPIAAGV